MEALFVNLLFAHLLGDFTFQPQCICDGKLLSGFRGRHIYIHTLMIFLLSWAFSFTFSFWWAALIISICHFVIDVCKSKFENCLISDGGTKIPLGKSRYGVFVFVIDFLLHIGVLFLISNIWYHNSGWEQIAIVKNIRPKYILLTFALLICWKPSNVFIRYVLRYFEVNEVTQSDRGNDTPKFEDHGYFKSGALIGTLERWLIITFIVLNQYEAIGFLLAAKSILRFNEVRGSEKSEYVLAGTFLSLTIALICGIFVITL